MSEQHSDGLPKSRVLQELETLFNDNAPLARTFGMHLSFIEDRKAVIDLAYNPKLDHAQGGIHGGVYATLLDCAGWFTAAAGYGTSSWIATSNLSIQYLHPSSKTDLRAVGNPLKIGKRQAVVEMHLYDAQGRLVGHATGTFIHLPKIPLHGNS